MQILHKQFAYNGHKNPITKPATPVSVVFPRAWTAPNNTLIGFVANLRMYLQTTVPTFPVPTHKPAAQYNLKTQSRNQQHQLSVVFPRAWTAPNNTLVGFVANLWMYLQTTVPSFPAPTHKPVAQYNYNTPFTTRYKVQKRNKKKKQSSINSHFT